ncbi:CoA transferase [Roseovarius sp. SCSIO 43702]|uniref:CaiB/BaiF CoA transferase family protein n=1 Tax=Roseovarius sp. SCSIO 43702 TaxID=2823043 RepID=UPI001C72E245|nr:CaiB/BaiF CoA-transferase family protein [Roseovarius sp. SCSIO 43702]QYX57601.1 CoA transferase [Roseovarius sp. SCSIO 43702]
MLNGVRVVEIEGLGPGPFAAMMLADLGAEVVVVHRPNKPDALTADPSLIDRGKRSILLDLKDTDDLEVAKALISEADMLIEGFRPGVMERLGLGPEPMHALNPALVYGRMTGWGQDGPKAHQAGHDFTYLASSGALWFASPPGEPPFPPPSLLGDVGGGALYLVAGLLAGYISALKTGRGTVVDAAIVDGSAHLMGLLMAISEAGHIPEKRGAGLLDGPHWSRSYVCACGGYIAVQAIEPKFYRAFLDALGLGDDPEMQSQNDPVLWPAQTARLACIFADEPRDHWAALLSDTDTCAAPVLSPSEAAQDTHNAARRIWQSDPLQPAPAPRFDGRRAKIRKPPARGQDRAVILAELRDRGLL